MSRSEPDAPRTPLRVRYYPRRVGRPAAPAPLSPGQALHLADDPARKALAQHTGDLRELPVTSPPAPPVAPPPASGQTIPDVPPVAASPAGSTTITIPPPAIGRWRRLWRRLTGTH